MLYKTNIATFFLQKIVIVPKLHYHNSLHVSSTGKEIIIVESLTLPGQCNPSQTFASQARPISRKAKVIGDIIRTVVDFHIDQVSVKTSLMDVSERQMSRKGCSVREGLSTLLLQLKMKLCINLGQSLLFLLAFAIGWKCCYSKIINAEQDWMEIHNCGECFFCTIISFHFRCFNPVITVDKILNKK